MADILCSYSLQKKKSFRQYTDSNISQYSLQSKNSKHQLINVLANPIGAIHQVYISHSFLSLDRSKRSIFWRTSPNLSLFFLQWTVDKIYM